MQIELTLKLKNGKKLKLSDSEARELRNALNNIYGSPNYWWTTTTPTYYKNESTTPYITFNDSTSTGAPATASEYSRTIEFDLADCDSKTTY